MKPILYISLFLLLMTGCKERPEVTASLDRAEELMESAPDSALTLLQTLDTETFLRRSTHARHALLFTQAQDKNYIDETNDSLISIAVDHYRQHGDVRSRFLSLYYNGRVQSNAGDRLNAMLSYAEAEELVDDLHDDYYAGLLYTQMGNLYRDYYDFPKSLEAYQKAEIFYQSANKDYHRQFAITDQSTVYRNMNEYSKSDSLLRTVLTEAKRMNYHSLIDYILGCLMMQYVEEGRMDDAKIIYNELKSMYGIDNNTSDFMYSVIKMYLSGGEIEEAELILDKAWMQAKTANDSIACHLAASEIYKAAGLFDCAMKEHEAGVLIQNRLVTESLQQPVLTIQCDFLERELEYQAYKRKTSRLMGIIIVAFIIVLALIAIYFLQKTLRRYYRKSLHLRLIQQEKENRRKMEELWEEAMAREHSILLHIEDLKNEIHSKDESYIEKITRLRNEIDKQNQIILQYKKERDTLVEFSEKECQKWKELCFLSCRTYFNTLEDIFIVYYYKNYENENSRYIDTTTVLYKYANGNIMSKKGKGYYKLEEKVNLYMNNVMKHFREEMESLNSDESIHLVCFLFAGFSVNFISNLMGCTPNAIYKRIGDIKKKIEKISPVHAEDFLKYMRKRL